MASGNFTYQLRTTELAARCKPKGEEFLIKMADPAFDSDITIAWATSLELAKQIARLLNQDRPATAPLCYAIHQVSGADKFEANAYLLTMDKEDREQEQEQEQEDQFLEERFKQYEKKFRKKRGVK